MLNYAQSSFLIIVAMAVSILIVAVLNRVWPIPSRKLINYVTGWQLGILGTTYGVILGFMLYTVWNDFRVAEINANLEASSLLTVSRIAAGLPAPQRQEFHALGLKYAQVAIDQEWPAMEAQQDSNASELVLDEMWKVLTEVRVEVSGGGNSVDHLTSALSDLSEKRNLREQEFQIRLPGILWLLLVAGAGATVGSSCLLGNDNKWLHYCQVLALTFVVAVTLAAIADLARPFEGAVSVSSVALQRARAMMQP